MGGQLTASLLAVAKLRRKPVSIEGVDLFAQEIGAATFAEYGELQQKDRGEAAALIIASCIIDADGEPVCTTDEARQIAQCARVVEPLLRAVMEVSGFSDEKEPDAA